MPPAKNLRDGTLVIADDGGSAGSDKITVALEEGNLRWSERRPVHFIMDRASLDHVRQAADVPVELSFTLKYTTHLDPNSATVTPYEALTHTGGASSWTSDASGGGDAYAVILEFTLNDPAGGTDEVVTFAEFYPETIDFQEGEQYNTLAVSGRANITAPAYS